MGAYYTAFFHIVNNKSEEQNLIDNIFICVNILTMLDSIKTYLALKDGPNISCAYSWNSPVFLFSNENIQPYLANLTDMTDKKVLTVAAAGDHAFEALLAGAKHVDTFDINYLQKHIMELKSKIIKHLPYGEFMKFFFDKNHFFDRSIIKPIWKTFSRELRIFLLMYYHHHQRNSRLFRYNGAQHNEYIPDMISYISDELAFKELKQIMPDKISFKETNVLELSTKFDTEYDVILMSNIFEYLYTDTTDIASRLKVFHANVLTPIAENILSKDGGKACFHYSWNTNVELWNQGLKSFERHTQYSIDSFNETKYSFDAIGVKSICSLAPNGQDAMLYMTQNQR